MGEYWKSRNGTGTPDELLCDPSIGMRAIKRWSAKKSEVEE